LRPCCRTILDKSSADPWFIVGNVWRTVAGHATQSACHNNRWKVFAQSTTSRGARRGAGGNFDWSDRVIARADRRGNTGGRSVGGGTIDPPPRPRIIGPGDGPDGVRHSAPPSPPRQPLGKCRYVLRSHAATATACFLFATSKATKASLYSPMARSPCVRLGSVCPSNPRSLPHEGAGHRLHTGNMGRPSAATATARIIVRICGR
jgi:hypothetical protein